MPSIISPDDFHSWNSNLGSSGLTAQVNSKHSQLAVVNYEAPRLLVATLIDQLLVFTHRSDARSWPIRSPRSTWPIKTPEYSLRLSGQTRIVVTQPGATKPREEGCTCSIHFPVSLICVLRPRLSNLGD